MTEQYIAVKTKKQGSTSWLNVADTSALAQYRLGHGNTDVLIPTWRASKPDFFGPRTYGLWFRHGPSHLEAVRTQVPGTCYYLAEYCGIPLEWLEVIYNAGGKSSDHADQDSQANAGTGDPTERQTMSCSVTAEMIIFVSPVAFNSRPTPLMPNVNRVLAEQMNAEGVSGLDLDIYVRDSFIPLANTLNSETGWWVTRFRVDEVIGISAGGILELSKQPRSDDGPSVCRVPEAAAWFAETLHEAERQMERQTRLRERLLRGWQVPACIRRLSWTDLRQNEVLEAYRIIASWYSYIQAGEDELWYHIRRMERHHGVGDYVRLANIIRCGLENPAFAGCTHPLLQRFCPAGGCFWKELVDEYEHPFLFG